MCLGAIGPLIGGLLSAVGTVVTMNEQQANAERQAAARNEKLDLVLRRNDPIAERSRETFDKRVADSSEEAIANDQAKAERTRTRSAEATLTDPNAASSDVPLAGSAPNVVRSEVAKQMLGVFEAGKDRAKKLAALGAYGDTFFNQGLQSVDTSRNLSIDSNFTAGNLSLLPYQQDIAENRAYKPISPIGGILSGLGGAFGGGGGGGSAYSASYTTPV